jgi:hypothetical protein
VYAASNCGTFWSHLAVTGFGGPIEWLASDHYAPPTVAAWRTQAYAYKAKFMIALRNQVYDTGSAVSNGVASQGTNAVDGLPGELGYPTLSGFEDNQFGNVPSISLSAIVNFELGGFWQYTRNNKRNNGAGTEVGTTTRYPNIGTGNTVYDGPYLIEATNSRPVPSAF